MEHSDGRVVERAQQLEVHQQLAGVHEPHEITAGFVERDAGFLGDEARAEACRVGLREVADNGHNFRSHRSPR